MTVTLPDTRLRLGISFAVTLLIAVLSFGLEFHHHDDGGTHESCPLCIALQQAQSASLNSRPAAVAVSPVLLERIPLPENEPIAFHSVKVPVIRPPPAIS